MALLRVIRRKRRKNRPHYWHMKSSFKESLLCECLHERTMHPEHSLHMIKARVPKFGLVELAPVPTKGLEFLSRAQQGSLILRSVKVEDIFRKSCFFMISTAPLRGFHFFWFFLFFYTEALIQKLSCVFLLSTLFFPYCTRIYLSSTLMLLLPAKYLTQARWPQLNIASVEVSALNASRAFRKQASVHLHSHSPAASRRRTNDVSSETAQSAHAASSPLYWRVEQ